MPNFTWGKAQNYRFWIKKHNIWCKNNTSKHNKTNSIQKLRETDQFY